MPRAAVTGGTGYLASELIAQLLRRGYQVNATVRSLRSESATRLAALPRSLGALPQHAHLKLFEADLLEAGSFDETVDGADAVFHTASPFITSNISDPESQLYQPALGGTRNVFGSIAKAIHGGAKRPRVVLTSSVAAIFGRPADKPDDQWFTEHDWNFSSTPEGNPVGDGLDLYRYSKLLAEREAWALASEHALGLSTVCPSFMIGPAVTPRTDGESLRNMRMALEGELPHRADTPVCDVRDVAAAHIAAAEVADAAGKRFLVTTERPVQRAQLLDWLSAAYPNHLIHDAGPPKDEAGLRKIFESVNLEVLGLTLRDPKESWLDMAEAMRQMGVVQMKPRDPAAAAAAAAAAAPAAR
jgi:nucleoside-diphosphate-sugar epimerase